VSIETRVNRGRDGKSYKTYRVRYLDGAAHRSATFRRLQDAKSFEGRVIDSKASGRSPGTAGRRITVGELGERWFKNVVIPYRGRKTAINTAGSWDRYVLPTFGGHRLTDLTPERLSEWLAELAVIPGGEAARKAAYALQGALEYAVTMQWLTANNLRNLPKPRSRKPRPSRPPSPRQIEAIRGVLLENGHVRDAVMVTTLAYAGLRPGELLALRWSDVSDARIAVERSISLGDEKETKTGTTRVVRLLPPLRDDLAAWRRFSDPPVEGYVFPRGDGSPWGDSDYRNWRTRVFYEACAEAGVVPRPTLYNLRTAFVSLLLAAGVNPVVIAQEAGHNVATLFRHYAKEIADLQGGAIHDATEAILAARLPKSYPTSDVTTSYRNKKVRRLQVESV
jgi:integrase